MGRKSVKDKEREYLEKHKGESKIEGSTENTYVAKPTEMQKAYGVLERKGYNLTDKDGVLFCNCNNEEEIKAFLQDLHKLYDKVPFSFGYSVHREKGSYENNLIDDIEDELEEIDEERI